MNLQELIIPESRKKIERFAKTIYGEAEGEGLIGQVAVGWVIRNRADDPGKDWWGDTIENVIMKSGQFECWDKRKDILDNLDLIHDPIGRQCLFVAVGVIYDYLIDPTDGSDHFIAKWMADKGVAPKWAMEHDCTKIIGKHIFYKLGSGN